MNALDLGRQLVAVEAQRRAAAFRAEARPPAAPPPPAASRTSRRGAPSVAESPAPFPGRTAPRANPAPPVPARPRPTPQAILHDAAALAGDPDNATDPSRALYLALRSARAGPGSRRGTAVHAAVAAELRARFLGRPIQGGLIRLGVEAGPAAVADLFRAAAARAAGGPAPPPDSAA